jgi:nucleotide-binding universal stress UspA family protein
MIADIKARSLPVRIAKILLPVDFSERGAGAAHYAKTLACRFHSELTLAHVLDTKNLMFSGEGGMPPEWFEDMRKEAQRLLDQTYADEFRDMPVRRTLLEGDVARSIADFAHAEHMDLIVMPTHGYGRFRRFILGSVTAKILHDIDCPVLTGVHMEEAPPTEPVFFRNLVCAVDFDPAGEKALGWAAAFADEFHSRLTMVHALPEIEVGQAHYFDQGLPMMLRQEAQERMDELQKRVGTAADVILDPGPVADVVRDAGTSRKADLVVIGRHENPGLLGRLRGNSYAIVRESPCPVLSV